MGRASDPAHSSAQSAKETAVKIEEAINKSAHGVQISDKVAQSLSEIIEKARKVDGFVSEIALASKEQNQGISQVNSAVSQMDKVTQSNAASAEETASAAEELNAQAALQMETVVELLNLVGITLTPATGFTENSNAKAATAKAYPPNGKASRAASGSKPGSRIASDRQAVARECPTASRIFKADWPVLSRPRESASFFMSRFFRTRRFRSRKRIQDSPVLCR